MLMGGVLVLAPSTLKSLNMENTLLLSHLPNKIWINLKTMNLHRWVPISMCYHLKLHVTMGLFPLIKLFHVSFSSSHLGSNVSIFFSKHERIYC